MDIVDLGSSTLNEATNAISAQCKGAEVSPGRDPDYGDVPLMCALGVAARPAPADGNGAAQGIVSTEIPGHEAACIAAFDPRSSDTYKELGPGETAVFATGAQYDSRLLCKDQLVAIIVGDDMAIVADRKNKKISISAAGQHFELTESGISMASTGASITIAGGTIVLRGTVMLGGTAPVGPVLGGTVAAPAVPSPIPGVFYGA